MKKGHRQNYQDALKKRKYWKDEKRQRKIEPPYDVEIRCRKKGTFSVSEELRKNEVRKMGNKVRGGLGRKIEETT